MTLHPQIIEKDGRKEFVVLPYEEFVKLQELLEDYAKLKTLRDEQTAAHVVSPRSLDEILADLGD